MNYLYLLPFSYFFNTRLRQGNVLFHVIFEWLAAAIVVALVGRDDPIQSLTLAFLCYLAFISVYEIGYLANDLFAAKNEENARLRGPQDASLLWIASWVVVRLVTFGFLTSVLGASIAWWSFFVALAIVFALHNVLADRELKSATFLWLAWFRFVAPIIFVIQDSQRMGVALAAAMAYAAFRQFGYLDSKGLLNMAGRHRPQFRLFFFLMPLVGALALWPYEQAFGFVVLAIYFAIAATLGTIITELRAPRSIK